MSVLKRAFHQKVCILETLDIQIITTSRCNLRCVYCHISGAHQDPSTLYDAEDACIEKVYRIVAAEKNTIVTCRLVAEKSQYVQIGWR